MPSRTAATFVRYGAPVIALCVAGSLGVMQVVQGKLDIQDSRGKSMLENEAALAEACVVGSLLPCQPHPVTRQLCVCVCA